MAQILLRFSQDEVSAHSEVTSLGGRVIHQFGSGAFVVELPDEILPAALGASTEEPGGVLDESARLAVEAWRRREAEGARSPSATEGLGWDAPGYQSPLHDHTLTIASESPSAVEESTGTPTSRYMVGSVAVGVVIVSRNSGTEAFTNEERLTVVQEVQEGLNWLASLEPRARVSFVYDIRPVTVSTAPGPYSGVSNPYERYEQQWRDDALRAMGYAPGRAGYQQYAQDLQLANRTDWAYVAFFTKYPLHHFAYAVDEKVVMHYGNDGWGTADINRVFAHESCHIFGAADEYGSCSCGGAHGHLGVPNGNCANCFPPGAQTPCLMNANTLSMCAYSRRQIGWDTSLYPEARNSISLWKVDGLGNQLSYKEHGPFDGWTPLNYADGRVLWRGPGNRISVWKVDANGNHVSYKEHGPFPGWIPMCCSDNHILWRGAGNRISLWRIDANGNHVSYKEHGPFPEWMPLNYSDGHILWRGPGNRISLWKVDADGNHVSYKEHGPFAGWMPMNYSDGRILWRRTDNRISLWNVDDAGNHVSYREHGPFAGWMPVNYADGRILWRRADNRISIWSVDAGGNHTSYREHGPFAGWTPLGVSGDRILWKK
ncbi:MAG: hypothetical protein JNN08_14125 [Bryobacterales bacterium]|nr:hypothetical protein [Bryobacterales bacterium]